MLEAPSADELERLLAEEAVGVILLDIRFGSVDGVEVARGLRDTHPAVAIAFFTGSAPELSDSARSLADAVVPKPFILEELSETVRRLARA